MLKSLEYSVTFPTTGRNLAQKVDFQSGFGAVIGPNEAGKSFIIEMIRWLMFGSKALRGKSDDYKTLEGGLKLAIKGTDYTIERTISQAKLFRGSEQIAVGTRPVNDKVAQLLGYGLSVFDTAHVANQGDIEKLGSMQPTERKRMVDSVIGLGVIEDMAKSAGDEANALKRRAEDLKSSVVEPEPVVEPEGYRPTTEVKEEVDDLAVIVGEYHEIRGWLAHQRQAPVLPTTDVAHTTEVLAVMAKAQRDVRAQRGAAAVALGRLPQASNIPNHHLANIEQAINFWEAYEAQQKFLALNPTSVFSEKDIRDLRKGHALWEQYQQQQQMQGRIEALLQHGSHCCPKCDHQWPVAGVEVKKLQADLDAMPRLRTEPTKPTVSMKEIDVQERILHNWMAVADQWVKHKLAIEVKKPDMTRAEIDDHRRANQLAAERETLMAEIAKLDALLKDAPDLDALLVKRQGYDNAMVRYEADLASYQVWQSDQAIKAERLGTLEPLVARLPELQQKLDQSRAYETARAQAEKAKARYDEVVATAASFAVEAADWDKARGALTALRGLVKQHLVPSLNRVASHLIKQMTGGERQKIVVDEDFNVLVDDQALNTLSGSGKAVANLALRLGLGQVLTNNVFSLFVGDEIDASMDKDRAENTANTLQTLKQRISQILLVTHKLPVADYYISLGNSNEPDYPE